MGKNLYGKKGHAQVTFDGYYGWQTVAKKVKMLNAKQYMELRDEQNINSGGLYKQNAGW